jgi:hypothetical protein
MSLIQNIRENHSEITFDIMNESTNLNTSFVNAIRRTILSDIRVYCIDKTKVNFFENTSVMDNEMIAERLMLSPIRSDLPDIDYNMIEISCDKRNQDEDIIGVFLEDFRVIDKTDDKEIPIDDFFPYKKILICNLRYNQSVSFEAKLTFNRVADGGTSAYCPVSTCVHTFGIDEQAVNDHIKEMSEMEKKKFMTRDVQRFIAKNRVNEPLIYQMKIESIEQLSAKKIVWIGLNELKNRILAFYSDLQSQTSRIHIALGNVFEDIISFYNSWDSYSIAITFLNLFSKLIMTNNMITQNETMIKFMESMLLSISPDPKKRPSVRESREKFGKIFYNNESPQEYVNLINVIDINKKTIKKIQDDIKELHSLKLQTKVNSKTKGKSE